MQWGYEKCTFHLEADAKTPSTHLHLLGESICQMRVCVGAQTLGVDIWEICSSSFAGISGWQAAHRPKSKNGDKNLPLITNKHAHSHTHSVWVAHLHMRPPRMKCILRIYSGICCCSCLSNLEFCGGGASCSGLNCHAYFVIGCNKMSTLRQATFRSCIKSENVGELRVSHGVSKKIPKVTIRAIKKGFFVFILM